MFRILFIFYFLVYNIHLCSQDLPNVIVILTDDQGSVDLNCYGASDLFTPHLDELAESGVRFTQFYAASPICSPSRAALLTGMNPHAAGLPSNASSQPGTKGMPSSKTTLAELMKANGYRTGHIGKWHLGYSKETKPNGQGFDYSFGHMGGCIDNYSHFFYWNGPNRHDLFENEKEVWYDGKYFPDLMHEKAAEFIVKEKDKPFFLYYAMNNPHYPLQPEQKWLEHYNELEHPRKEYAAFISSMDERVGQLLDLLDKENLRENTILIFQSDHGHSVEERAFHGGGSSGIFRGAKTSLFDGGIRVPAIISWPNKIQAGKVNNKMAVSIDWFATIADYCKIKTQAIEGRSLRNVIDSDARSPHEKYIWKLGVSWAIRKGDWKLIGFPNDPVDPSSLHPDSDLLFLSNLSTDPSEKINHVSSHPDIKEELLAEYLRWEYASLDDVPQEKEAISSLAKMSTVTLRNEAHRNYNHRGPKGLTDEIQGSKYFKDGNWLGFEVNDLEVIIDLGKRQKFKSIKIGTLQNPGAWIFLPKSATISWSSDGRKYSQLKTKQIDTLGDRKNQIHQIEFNKLKAKARYIKIHLENTAYCPDWHQAKGQKAWLFVDEIIVN